LASDWVAAVITVLIGHRGVGKTTLLKRIELVYADREDATFKDLDEEIELLERRTLVDIFRDSGEAAFRKIEEDTFLKIVSENEARGHVFLSVGAGFEFEIPEKVHVVWIRRATDEDGRIFLNRPGLSTRPPLEEWQLRFAAREARYLKFADEELTLPEGSLHDSLIEEHFFSEKPKSVPWSLTLRPENFRAEEFLERRLKWGLKYFELRDDLLTPEQIERAKAVIPAPRILLSFRKSADVQPPPETMKTDWAMELGTPPSWAKIVSLHSRLPKLSDTMRDFSMVSAPQLKFSPEILSFQELLEGHMWWRQDPSKRSFLPRSSSGRWQWYRQLFGPLMALNFFREGEGTSSDQPYLWQTLATPPLNSSFAAILGSPVRHSWTPSFQREFFEPQGIPIVAIPIKEEEWETALPILKTLGLKFAAVTSPLKKKAKAVCVKLTPEAEKFESVNTLACGPQGWSGHNTDIVGAKFLLSTGFTAKEVPLLVWGGGGVKEVLRAVIPNAIFVSARDGMRLTEPVNLVLAVGRGREFVWPQPAVFIQSVVDLNYSEDSPGLEIAQRAGSPYKSGELMFIHQGLAQREFWKRFL
jgi:shikimate 5-dehydrogenase/shikimate kinase